LTRWTQICESQVLHPPILHPALPLHNELVKVGRRRLEYALIQSCSKDKNLKTLSELGHFLKGSSATLGLTKVKDSCEKIQHYGSLKDETGGKDIKEGEALDKLKPTIEQAKKEFEDVEKVLRKFYKDEA
jgi:osomolarity two-component system phosphorelay intermediate protein YPD1